MPMILLDFLILLGLLILGYWIARSIIPDLDAWISVGVGFPLGAGIFSWFLFLLSWLGIVLNLLSISLSLLGLLVVAAGIHRFRASTSAGLRGSAGLRESAGLQQSVGLLENVGLQDRNAESHSGPGSRRWMTVAFTTCGVLLFASALVAVGRSYSTWDAIAIWAAKGYGIALEGTVFAGEIWGSHHLNYPLNIPILISLFRLLEGDLLPGSKLIFPLFYISLLLGCYSFWRASGLKRGFAAIGLLFISTIPLVYSHATIGYANLPFSVYLVLGTLVGIVGILNRSKNMQLLSGLLLALAAWTRPEGVFLVPITIIALMLAFKIVGSGEVRFWGFVLPGIIIVIPWTLFSGLYGSGGMFQSATSQLLESFRAGDFHLDSFYWIARYLGRQLIEIKAWGLLLPVAALVLVTQRSKFQPRRFPAPFLVLTLSAVIGLSITAFYYLVSFEGDLRVWLETGVNRMYLPAGLLGAVWAVVYAGVPEVAESIEIGKPDEVGSL